MCDIITVTNQKGGIGKSTTAHQLGAGYSIIKGLKVLMIDLDPQANLTIATGVKRDMPNSYDLLMLKKTPQEVIQSISDKLDIILASNQLSRVAIELDKTGKEYRLKEVLAPVKDKYELIIIDTPPALGILTINALTIAKRIHAD